MNSQETRSPWDGRKSWITVLVSKPCGDVAGAKPDPSKRTHQHSLNSLGWLRVNQLLPHFTMKRLLFYRCHRILVATNCKIQPAILGEHPAAYSKLLCSKLNWWTCHKVCGPNRSPHYRLHARRLLFACRWACKEANHVLASSYIFQIAKLVVYFVAILMMDLICFYIGRWSMESSLYQRVHWPVLLSNHHAIIPAFKRSTCDPSPCVTATALWTHLPLSWQIIANPPHCLWQEPGRHTKGLATASQHAEPWSVQANHLSWVNYVQVTSTRFQKNQTQNKTHS